MLLEIRTVILLLGILSAQGLRALPPVTFLDEAGTRFITIETFESGKVAVSFRSVGGPGSYGRWLGTGEQMPKGLEFSRKVEDDAAAGPVYLATGGQSRLAVKLKPGQAGIQDAGLSGVYHHISDEKVASLAKKDYDAAEKKLDEAIKAASHKAPADDKPTYAEWKKAWPALRDRIVALSGAKTPTSKTPPGSTKPLSEQQTPAVSAEKQASYWIERAEATGRAISFIGPGVPMGLKPGWEGNYDDGFGGSIEIFVVTNGDARFNLNAARGPEGAGGNIEGRVPADTIKTAKDGASTGEFRDNNKALNDGKPQTLLHFRRTGHFLIIESQYAERYSRRGWFDGIFMKRPPPKDE